MSNFFERELGRVFGDGQVIRNPTYSGRSCFGTGSTRPWMAVLSSPQMKWSGGKRPWPGAGGLIPIPTRAIS